MTMSLLITVSIGLAVGVMVELLLPGHRPLELIFAMLLGVAGALLTRFIGAKIGWFGTEEPESFVTSGLGSIVLLTLFGLFLKRRPPGGPS